MTHYDDALFQPLKIGSVTAKNRIACSPHGSALHELDGTCGLKLYKYIENIAKGGAATITLGVCNVDRQPMAAPVAYLNNPFAIGSYVNLTELCHQYGALASMELVGGKEMFMPAEAFVNQTPVERFKEFAQEFADAADFCVKAGFDMIMVHGAHGMPIAAMLRESLNHRTDEYGGSFENRARLGVEILDAIRAKVGNKLAIEYRISDEEVIDGGNSLEETIKFAQYIQDKVDMFHVSRGILELADTIPYTFTPTYYPHGINIERAAKFKAALNKPVNVVGAITFEQAEEAIASGKVDMVAMARQLIADPSAVNKYMRGQDKEIRPCVRCNTCIGQVHYKLWDLRCAINPLCGRETYFPQYGVKTTNPKKVLLVGGGPANLEAARTASKRGHKVIIADKNDRLGGTLIYAAAADIKADMKKYLDWSVRTVMEDPNIDVRLNTVVTPEYIRNEAPDAVIIAVGSEPIIPHFTASGTSKIAWVGDYELGKANVGESVVVCGGGFTGLEAAYEMSRDGKRVTVVDMLPKEQLGAGGTMVNTIALMQMLGKAGVEFACETRIEDITKEGVIIKNEDGKRIIECDTAVLSFGFKTDKEKVRELYKIIPESYIIGDCSDLGGTIWRAVRSGFDMAMAL